MKNLAFAAFLAPVASFVITLAAIAWMLIAARAHLPLDLPNRRSLHTQAVPCTGGVAILAGLLIGAGFAAPQFLWLLTLGAGLALLSFVDDLRGVAVSWRLLAHFLVATLFMLWAFPAWPWLAVVLAVLAISWMTNLFNFMDGADGLAGGMALIGFGFLGAAAWGEGASLAMLCACASASAAAFLLFNFNPARIFMGDAGSIPLGFLAAALGLLGWREALWPLWFPLLVFSPFIVDASVTLTRRIVRGEKVWQAHHDHYYQRLVRMGWSHRRTALAEYALMAFCGGSAWWAIGQGAASQAAVFGIIGILFLALMVLIDYRWRSRPTQSHGQHS